MAKLITYTSSGTKSASVSMPKTWQEKENDILLAQAIRVYEWAKHPGTSKVKTRGEVAYSTRKIYKQKGTGQARHGDRGAPIFVKGGVAHGPRGIKRKLSLPKKMRTKALKVALTLKQKEGGLLVISNISKLKKTKDAAVLVAAITTKEKKIKENSRFTFALSEKNKEVILALRNLKNVNVLPFRNLNAHAVYLGGVLVIDKEAISEQKNQGTKELKNKRVKGKKSSTSRTGSKSSTGKSIKKSK